MAYGKSSGAPVYQLVSGAAEYPITLTELKAWLKITNTAQDDILNSIISAVTKNAELYTKREFIEKEFKTYRDFFGERTDSNYGAIELRRTPVGSVTSVKYLDADNTLTTVAGTVYYYTVTDGGSFSLLDVDSGQTWPSDLSSRLQAVEVIFKAGYADAATFKLNAPDLWQSLFAHMANVFTNRGDCSIAKACECGNAPAQAASVYDQYRIIDFASAC